MTPEQVRDRVAALRQQISAEPAFRVEQEMQFVNRMTEMTARNSAELQLAIRAISDPRLRSIFPSRLEDPREEELLEVIRRLDNYLASAISRVDRCPKSAGYLSDIEPALKMEAKQRRVGLGTEHPIFLLAEYLRDHSIHVSYHGVQVRLTFQPLPEEAQPPREAIGARVTLTARVRVVRPQVQGGRSRRDREFAAKINQFPAEIEIQAFVHQFNAAADQFVTWYFSRLRSLHLKHGRSLEVLRSELQALNGPAALDNREAR